MPKSRRKPTLRRAVKGLAPRTKRQQLRRRAACKTERRVSGHTAVRPETCSASETAQLIEAAQRGVNAYGELARRVRPQALRTARAILRNDEDAEDAVQEALLTGLVNVRAYEAKRGGFGQWINGIVRKRCATMLRTRGQAQTLTLDELHVVALTVDALDQVQQRERLQIVADAIVHLPPLQKAVIEFVAAGRTRGEISFALGITPHAVAMNLSRARRTLKRTLNAA